MSTSLSLFVSPQLMEEDCSDSCAIPSLPFSPATKGGDGGGGGGGTGVQGGGGKKTRRDKEVAKANGRQLETAESNGE